MSVPRAVLGASILAAFLLCLPLAGAQGLLVIHSPANMTYNTTQVGLNWSSGEELDWAWYSLNGAGNASLMLLQNRFNGSAAEKNLTFASAGSQLVYIDLPKNLTSVVSAVANLTGYQSEGSDDYLDVSSDQDSDIKSLWPDSNWDDETDGDGSCSGCNLGLNRNSSQGSNNQALVKFDVSGFSGAFSSARLYLHRTSNNGFIEVYNTSDAWSEGAVTWNNAPAFGALLASGYVGDSGWESFAGSELSDYVSYELASGNQLASFRLNTSYEGD
ncbi:MAG: DNRLRE domain-containing protein, partial [Candidatus Aenigmatarchaeota archaeon]